MSVFSNKISRFYVLLALLFLCGFSSPALASETENDSTKFNASEVLLHHVVDDHIWHFWDGHYGTLYLPVIVYSSERGLDVFSSHNFYDEHHKVVEYNGYKLEHNHVTLNGKSVLDVSITKNVAMLLLNATLLLLVFLSVASGVKKN